MKTFLLILCMLNLSLEKNTSHLRRRNKHKSKKNKKAFKKRYRSKKSKSRSKRSNTSSSSSYSSSCLKTEEPPTPPQGCIITGYTNPPTIQMFQNLTFSNSTTTLFQNKYLNFLESCYQTCSTLTGTKTRTTCEDMFLSLNEKECQNDSECLRVLNLNLLCIKTIPDAEVCLKKEICVGLQASTEFTRCPNVNISDSVCLTMVSNKSFFDVCSVPDLIFQCLEIINCKKNNLNDPLTFNISYRSLIYNVTGSDPQTIITVNNPSTTVNLAEFTYDDNLKFESENLMALILGTDQLVKTSFGPNSPICVENGFSFLFDNETKVKIEPEKLFGICSSYS